MFTNYMKRKKIRKYYYSTSQDSWKRKRLNVQSVKIFLNIQTIVVNIVEGFTKTNNKHKNIWIINKIFKNSLTLRQHRKTHEIGGNWECQVCGKGFKTKRRLNSSSWIIKQKAKTKVFNTGCFYGCSYNAFEIFFEKRHEGCSIL